MPLELPQQDPCFFCEIVAGRADRWAVVSEDDLTLTLLNGRQYETGQCMILPIRHAPTLLDLTADESAAVMASAQQLTGTMLQAFDTDGILLYQNNGIGSGQEVPHFHLHVVPRQPGSDWGLGPPHIARLERERHPPQFDHTVVTDQKRTTAEKLRRQLADSD